MSAAAPAQSSSRGNRFVGTVRRLLGTQEVLLLALLVALFIGVGLNNGAFWAWNNVSDLFNVNAYIAVAAIGASMIIITGNIDISVGAAIGVLVTLSGYVALGLRDAGLPLIVVNVVAWLVPVFGGMLIGAINGFFVAYLRIPAIVVTLGMFSILKGGLILVAGGNTLYNLPAGYSFAMEDLLGVPIPVWIMIVLTAVAFLWMRYSRTGRSQYAVGGNVEAARLSGLDTRRILMTTFILSGLFTGIASIMYATQFQDHPGGRDPRPGAAGHHGRRGGRCLHPGRRGHRHRLHAGGHPHPLHRRSAGLREHLALLGEGHPGCPHPRDRALGRGAPPAPGTAVGAAEMTTQPVQSRSDQPSLLQRILLRQETILFIILVVGVLVLSMQSDKFLTVDNLLNQGRLATEIALIALPMTLIIITGGIDLSVGSIMGLVAIMLGVAWYNWGLPLELALVVALLIGAACGLFNGLFITRVGLPPLITTLATLALFRGLAEGIAQGRSVRGYPDWFFILGQKNFLGDLTSIPNQLLVVVLAIIAIGAALAWTPFGRSLYAIGNNETGARFSGLPVARNKLLIYTLSGFMSGLAAWVYVSRVSTTRQDYGNGIELTAITAVVVGGTSIFGGSGTILGTVLGLALIQLMKNGLGLSGAKGDSTTIVVGVILIGAVLLNTLIQNPPERLKRLLPGRR